MAFLNYVKVILERAEFSFREEEKNQHREVGLKLFIFNPHFIEHLFYSIDLQSTTPYPSDTIRMFERLLSVILYMML